ncbi:hypothetical protein [Paenibacillus gansuensis]|uniref:Uncharacterized protein n=1 Tax=Paenibacillus gansuensis TaxID=306542 RepID=A0ABW5PI68_9BACL
MFGRLTGLAIFTIRSEPVIVDLLPGLMQGKAWWRGVPDAREVTPSQIQQSHLRAKAGEAGECCIFYNFCG